MFTGLRAGQPVIHMTSQQQQTTTIQWLPGVPNQDPPTGFLVQESDSLRYREAKTIFCFMTTLKFINLIAYLMKYQITLSLVK